MDTKTKQTNMDTVKKAKTFKGTVVSTSMKDTVVVKVGRYVKHPKYGKFIKHSKKIKAHDVGNTKAVGDTVEIVETKPISKGKSFIVA